MVRKAKAPFLFGIVFWLFGCSPGRFEAPLHELEFEDVLRRGGSTIDAVLAIDKMGFPELNVAGARGEYDRLLGRMTVEGVDASSREGAARGVLRMLELEGYSSVDLSLRRFPSGPDPSVLSFTLLHREGTCGSLSLLVLALLEAVGVEAFTVCVPDHLFLRVIGTRGEEDLESTLFAREGPGGFYTPEMAERAGRARLHLCRSLDARQSVWHYFVAGLWFRPRSKESSRSLLCLLDQAEEVLGGSCVSLENLRIRLNLMLGKKEGRYETDDPRALAQAEQGLLLLLDWDPSAEDASVLLRLIRRCRGEEGCSPPRLSGEPPPATGSQRRISAGSGQGAP